MKKPPRSYGFQERLDFSNGHAPGPESVFSFLKARIPNFHRVRKAAQKNDQGGCDYFVERYSLPSLGFDLKLRGEDFSVKAPPLFADDLALETFSVVEKNIPGWTRDASKSTDYILWFWQDTGRFFILPFPALCCVFQHYWKEWREQYPRYEQRTPGRNGRSSYRSECVFVPRSTVVESINRWMNGRIGRTA